MHVTLYLQAFVGSMPLSRKIYSQAKTREVTPDELAIWVGNNQHMGVVTSFRTWWPILFWAIDAVPISSSRT